MNDKVIFIEQLKNRTKQFALDIIKLCNSLSKGKAADVITYQLIKSATSVGANYRAACRARSKTEFYSKMCIVVEEADETEYWLEIIENANMSDDKTKLEYLIKESNEITKIMSKSKDSARKIIQK